MVRIARVLRVTREDLANCATPTRHLAEAYGRSASERLGSAERRALLALLIYELGVIRRLELAANPRSAIARSLSQAIAEAQREIEGRR